jgi:lysozyme family protein
MSAFAKVLPYVLQSEGGKVDDKRDPGGRTAYGVTQTVFSGWLRSQAKPVRDVWTITPAEISAIYRNQYWDGIRGDELPAGVDYAVFDFAVNSGCSRATKALQRAIGGLVVDGHIGNATMSRIADIDAVTVIDRICDDRLRFMKALKTWRTFGRGWSSRVEHVRKVAKALAAEAPDAAAPVYFADGGGKAWERDQVSKPSTALADTLSGAGGSTAVLSQVVDQLRPVADVLPLAGQWLAVATAIGAVIGVLGFAYRSYATRRSQEIADALAVSTSPTTQGATA